MFLLSFSDRCTTLTQHSSASCMSALVTSDNLSASLCFAFRSLINIKSRAVTRRRRWIQLNALHAMVIFIAAGWPFTVNAERSPANSSFRSFAIFSGRHSSGSNSSSNQFGLSGPSESVSHFGSFHHKVIAVKSRQFIPLESVSARLSGPGQWFQHLINTVLHKMFPLLRTLYNPIPGYL